MIVIYKQKVITDPMVIIVYPGSIEEFRDVIQAGVNLNPNLSPGMKVAADLITSGEIQQDYYAQAGFNYTPNL